MQVMQRFPVLPTMLFVASLLAISPAVSQAQGWGGGRRGGGGGLGESLRQLFQGGGGGGGGSQRYKGGANSSGFQNQNGFEDGNDFFGSNNSFQYQRPSTTYYRPVRQSTQPTYTYPSTSYNAGQVTYGAQVAYSSPKTLQEPPLAPLPRLPIVLEVPKGEIGICAYQLLTPSGRAYDYTITPGQRQSFTNTTQWKIRYDQGQGKGVKTYDLRGGKSYEMRKDDAGLWQLFTQR